MAKEPKTPVERRMVLEAFGRAIDRETHNLSRWPDLVWQQLYNRLQWEGDPLPSLLTQRSTKRSDPRPWIRMTTPFWESRGLLRTLAGHMEPVSGCAVSPGSAYIVSAGWHP
jgi:hypothetical protein